MITEIKIDFPVTRIGLVSDTHIPTRARSLPKALFTVFQDVQLILHAGDLVEARVLAELGTLAPVYAVGGNMDPPEIKARLGRKKLIRIGTHAIGLIHGDGLAGTTRRRAEEAFAALHPDAIVFGHNHAPLCEYNSMGILLFNPGSAVDRRRAPRCSCGILDLEKKAIPGRIVYF